MPFIIIIIICSVLVTNVVLLIVFLYLRIFYHNSKGIINLTPLQGKQYDKYDMASLINKAADIEFSEVWIKSFDGLNLYARLYYQFENAPIDIQFNGYKGNGIRDFSGGMQLALKLKHNVLLVDQRAHGKSSGHTITFGIKERIDCLSWVNYVIDKFGNVDIFLDGVSMGAATVLMASNLDLPKNVKGIIADCPYSSPLDIINKVTSDMHVSPKFMHIFFLISARFLGHFNLKEASALEAVKNCKIPILIIHGTDDLFVPIEMSRKIKEQNKDMIRMVEVDGAPHGLSYLEDEQLYSQSVKLFYDECLDKKTN